MNETNIYLSYYDVMILLTEFEELGEDDHSYVSLLVEQYSIYFYEQVSYNISRGSIFNVPNIVLNNLKIYSMSVSLYELLIKLTGVDLKDRKFKKYYKKFIKSYEEWLINKNLLDMYKSKKLVRREK